MKNQGEVPKSAYSKASGQSVVTLDVSVEARVAEIEGRTNVTNPPPHQTKTQHPTSVATDVGMIGERTEANYQPALASSVPKEIWNELIVALRAYQSKRNNNPTFHQADVLSRGYSKEEKIGAVNKLIDLLVEPNNFEMFTLREYESLCGGKVKTILDSHAFTPLNIMELIKTDLTRQLQETNSSLDLMGLQANEQSVALQQKHAELGDEQGKVQGLQAQVEHLDLKYAKEKLQFEKAISHLGETQAAEKARLHADFQVAQKKYTTAESQLKIQVAAALKETAGLKTKLEIKTQNFISLTQSFRDLSAGFYQANNRVNALNEALKTATSLNKQEKAQFSADRIALNSARFAVDDKLLSTEKQLVNVKGNNELLLGKIRQVEAVNNDLKREVRALMGSVEVLTSKLAVTNTELAYKRREVHHQTEALAGMGRQLEDEKAKAQGLQAQANLIGSKFTNLQDKIKGLTDSHADLTRELSAAKDESSGLTAQIKTLRAAQAAELIRLQAASNARVSELEGNTQTLSTKNAELQASVAFLEETSATEKKEQFAQILEKNIAIQQKTDDVQRLSHEVCRLNVLNEDLRDLNVALQEPVSTSTKEDLQLGLGALRGDQGTLLMEQNTMLSPISSQKYDRWHRFYAEYKPEGDAEADNSRYTNEALFKRASSSSAESEPGILFAVNMTHKEMSQKLIKEFEKGAVPVICPTSGHEYSLSFKGNIPVAVLKAENAQRFAGDSDDQHLQRRAATIINMIDNVLAKSEEITITTSDPFLAEIASSYLAYLKTIADASGAQVLTMNVKSLTSNASEQEKKKATSIFAQLHMPVADIQTALWFKDALAFRAEYPRGPAQPI